MTNNLSKSFNKVFNKAAFSPLESISNRVIYKFVIDRYEIFTSNYGQDFLKFVFSLSNENEVFEESQIFPIDTRDYCSPRFEEFVEQFSEFCQLSDDNTFDDFIGEKGECYIDPFYYNGRTYRKLIITALEDNSNE